MTDVNQWSHKEKYCPRLGCSQVLSICNSALHMAEKMIPLLAGYSLFRTKLDPYSLKCCTEKRDYKFRTIECLLKG